MKKSTIFFIFGTTLVIGAVSLIMLGTMNKDANIYSLYIANIFGYSGLGCFFGYKKQFQAEF
jgi:hypothetical protein